MDSLAYLHFISFLIIFLNVLIFNKNTNDLGTKYFFINYIYHHHKQVSCFLLIYPFLIILMYFLLENIFLISTFFISILYCYFSYEIISKKQIDKKEAYIYWYKKNVVHSFSMHYYDVQKKDFNFLSKKTDKLSLFKFEIIFFVSLVVESEVMYEVINYFGNLN